MEELARISQKNPTLNLNQILWPVHLSGVRELAICRKDFLEADLVTISNKMKTEITPSHSFSNVGIVLIV